MDEQQPLPSEDACNVVQWSKPSFQGND
jgi:hypothetical protein